MEKDMKKSYSLDEVIDWYNKNVKGTNQHYSIDECIHMMHNEEEKAKDTKKKERDAAKHKAAVALMEFIYIINGLDAHDLDPDDVRILERVLDLSGLEAGFKTMPLQKELPKVPKTIPGLRTLSEEDADKVLRTFFGSHL